VLEEPRRLEDKERGGDVNGSTRLAVESRFGPKRGFGETPGELLTLK